MWWVILRRWRRRVCAGCWLISAIAHAGYILLGLAYFSYFAAERGGGFSIRADICLNDDWGRLEWWPWWSGLRKRSARCVSGIAQTEPGAGCGVAVLFLSLGAFPPLVGFWGEVQFVLRQCWGCRHVAVSSCAGGGAVGMSAVSLDYYLQVLKRAYVMQAVDETAIQAPAITMIVLVGHLLRRWWCWCFPALLQGWIEGSTGVL